MSIQINGQIPFLKHQDNDGVQSRLNEGNVSLMSKSNHSKSICFDKENMEDCKINASSTFVRVNVADQQKECTSNSGNNENKGDVLNTLRKVSTSFLEGLSKMFDGLGNMFNGIFNLVGSIANLGGSIAKFVGGVIK